MTPLPVTIDRHAGMAHVADRAECARRNIPTDLEPGALFAFLRGGRRNGVKGWGASMFQKCCVAAADDIAAHVASRGRQWDQAAQRERCGNCSHFKPGNSTCDLIGKRGGCGGVTYTAAEGWQQVIEGRLRCPLDRRAR